MSRYCFDGDPVYAWRGPPRIRLLRGPARLPSGLEYHAHKLEAGHGTAVVVMARRSDHILFVESHRPLVGARLLELPRGFADAADRDPLETASRELREESGWSLHAPRVIGDYWTDTGLYPAPVSVIEGEARTPTGAPAPPGPEVLRTRWVHRTRLASSIASGEFQDAHTLSALALHLNA